MSSFNTFFSKINKHPLAIILTLLSSLLGIIGFFISQPAQNQKSQIQNSPRSNVILNSPGSVIIRQSENRKGNGDWWPQKTKTDERAHNSISQSINNSPGSFQIGKTEGPVIINQPTSLESLSDVGLSFVYPKSPALKIVNLSDSVAREIKWSVVLWNMDLPNRDDPLPIPVSKFDWIKGHDESGPQSLFGTPLVAPLLKPGNRLIGTAAVNCPTCTRGRTYIVYIVWGEDGWFSEVENEKSGHLLLPANVSEGTRVKYFEHLEAKVPKNLRLPISEH